MLSNAEYITAVREFLLTVPFPAPLDTESFFIGGINGTGIDYGRIVQGEGSDRWGTGCMIQSSGLQRISQPKSVTGRTSPRHRINFAVEFWRSEQDGEFIRNITNFLNDMINWIEYENSLRNTPDKNPYLPKFSMTNFEEISATGGVRVRMIDDVRAAYGLSIHCDFDLLL